MAAGVIVRRLDSLNIPLSFEPGVDFNTTLNADAPSSSFFSASGLDAPMVFGDAGDSVPSFLTGFKPERKSCSTAGLGDKGDPPTSFGLVETGFSASFVFVIELKEIPFGPSADAGDSGPFSPSPASLLADFRTKLSPWSSFLRLA